MSMLRVISILLLCFILINLFVGLFHLLRNKGDSNKVVRSLTIPCGVVDIVICFHPCRREIWGFPRIATATCRIIA